MMLLGAMVFTRAFLVGDPTVESSVVSRDNSLSSNFQEALMIRVEMDQTENAPVAQLFSQNFHSPEYVSFHADGSNNFTHVQTTYVTLSLPNDQINDLSHEVSNEAEIIPMDIQMNTGYGLWKSPNEKILSKEDRNGAIPLDRGNTITDNISKLFPRVP